MAQNSASITFEDWDSEISTTKINIGPITALNFLAIRSALDTLVTALNGITLGQIRKTNLTETFQKSTAAVSNRNAQRESKWLVTCRDVTEFFDIANTINNPGFGNIFTLEVPTANLTLLPAVATDELDLTGAAAAAFITALEAIHHSPTGGNEIEVVSIRHVGRST